MDSDDLWWLILRLGIALISVDAYIRWAHLEVNRSSEEPALAYLGWSREAAERFLRIMVGCLVETAAFHFGIVLASYIALEGLDRIRTLGTRISTDEKGSGIRQEFRYTHIPLTLLYSSFTKLFLLFLLSIWRPALSLQPSKFVPHADTTGLMAHPFVASALRILDEDRLDREWVVRNIIGGMAAGFGLRVVLDDCHPLLTTAIILSGWGVKTVVASLVSGWVGKGLGDDGKTAGEMWLSYSIP